jgi:hypothetical protein
MMKDDQWIFVTGVLLGMFSFAMGTLVADVFDSTSDMNKKKQCEKTLPRNQYCVMIAVPDVNGETK